MTVKLKNYGREGKRQRENNRALFLLNLTAGLPDAPGFNKACGIEAHEVRNFFNHLNAGVSIHGR